MRPFKARSEQPIVWPEGRDFAFTVVDDTDWASVETVKPVYDFLADAGLRTTKTVWMFPGDHTARNPGSSCEEKEYLEWVLSLQGQGFEIALHNAAASTSFRDRTAQALDSFTGLFGGKQILFCNHTGCLENIYWGEARLSGWRRLVYNLATRGRRQSISRGHIRGDSLFWGDLCQERVRYVRNFVFDELNALKVCPVLPYHDATKPYVNFWFPSADGANIKQFIKNFTRERLKALAAQGGLCIAYVHFAAGFTDGGRINQAFKDRIQQVASLNGWFAPASEVLEFMRNSQTPQQRTLSRSELAKLEWKWLAEKLIKGTT